MSTYFIASCVFTSRYPALAEKIQDYLQAKGIPTVRCCTPKYKLKIYEEKMPADYRPRWAAYPDTAPWAPGDTAVTICHNCANIAEEQNPGVRARSLYEVIAEDPDFPLPDCSGMTVALQDCWRSRDRRAEQEAVRVLLDRMHIRYMELPENFEKSKFCGVSVLAPQPPRNPTLAPSRYTGDAVPPELFQPHTEEEKQAVMEAYCAALPTKDVLCYCHYCLDGINLGGANGILLAELLFR